MATFTNLTLAGTVGTNYTLTFASSGLTSAVSNNVTVTVGAANKIALNTGDNQVAAPGGAVAVNPSVLVTDVGNNPVRQFRDLRGSYRRRIGHWPHADHQRERHRDRRKLDLGRGGRRRHHDGDERQPERLAGDLPRDRDPDRLALRGRCGRLHSEER